MNVIERAEQRLNDEIRQHELGLDNVDDIQYWLAYLDGARAQKKELTTYPSRKEAELVKALRCCGNEGCHKCPYKKHIHEKFCWVIAMKDAAAAIEALQAQLPKHGEWKPFDLTYGRSIYYCSVCEQATEVPMCMEKPMYAYCPYCGAKMREVQDGN